MMQVKITFPSEEIDQHFTEALSWINGKMSPILINFHYHCALLYNWADKAAGIRKAMEENNIPVSTKHVKPINDKK